MSQAQTRTADFRAQNLRWHGLEARAVHDRDGLAWQPEAALAGAVLTLSIGFLYGAAARSVLPRA